MRWQWAGDFIPLMAASLLAVFAGVAMSMGWWTKNPWVRGTGVVLVVFGVSLSLLFLIFFRDPDRFSNAEENKIISPADGRVMMIETVEESKVLGGQARRIAIFMHVGNVHVQRVPLRSKLLWTTHHPGKFLPAFYSQAGFENEQRWYAFERQGRSYAVVQIAGLLARRIRCWAKPGVTYERGDRFGMISFGSEVDLYLPLAAEIAVKPGDIVRAGESVIGEWR